MSLYQLPNELIASIGIFLNFKDNVQFGLSQKRIHEVLKRDGLYKPDCERLVFTTFIRPHCQFSLSDTTDFSLEEETRDPKFNSSVGQIINKFRQIDVITFYHVKEKMTDDIFEDFVKTKTQLRKCELIGIEISFENRNLFVAAFKKFHHLNLVRPKMSEKLYCDEIIVELMPFTTFDINFRTDMMGYSLTDRTLEALADRKEYYNFEINRVLNSFTVAGVKILVEKLALCKSVIVNYNLGILKFEEEINAVRWMEEATADPTCPYTINRYDEVFAWSEKIEYYVVPRHVSACCGAGIARGHGEQAAKRMGELVLRRLRWKGHLPLTLNKMELSSWRKLSNKEVPLPSDVAEVVQGHGYCAEIRYLPTPKIKYDVEIASSLSSPMTTTQEKIFRKEISDISICNPGVSGVTRSELLRIARRSVSSVREFIALLFNHFNPENGIYTQATIVSALSWCNRKFLHRDALLSCVSNLEYVTEEEMEEYIRKEAMSSMSDRLDSRSLETGYKNQASVGIFFPLGGSNCSSLKVETVLFSGVLDEIDGGIAMSFRIEDYDYDNWFSIQNTIFMVYAYRELDTDHFGMLTECQLLNFNRGLFNPLFINGIFRSQPTFVCEDKVVRMDYRGFCILNRAIRYMSTIVPTAKSSRSILERPCIRYAFECLDINGCGYWDRPTLLFIVQSLLLHASTFEALEIDEQDLTDEIFDIVHPADGLRITLNDLFNCTRANTVLGMLIDVDRLCAYENSEFEAENLFE